MTNVIINIFNLVRKLNEIFININDLNENLTCFIAKVCLIIIKF